MRTFKDFKTFNEYIGLPMPFDNDIDIGYYDVTKMRLQAEILPASYFTTFPPLPILKINKEWRN